MRRGIGICTLALSVLLTRGALAVLQPTPGGITIPVIAAGVSTCSDKNAQKCLDAGEHGAGLIDAQKDALVSPETFEPTCSLTFTPVNKGGSISVAFGWYNVKPDPNDAKKTLKPASTELYAMMVLPQGFQSNAQLASVAPKTLDLNAEKVAGRYQGGKIAFWLASDSGGGMGIGSNGVLTGTPNVGVFYTEHAFNPGSGATQTYYQVLTWQSVATKNAFYFGWEDLPANAGADNDFDDLFFLVTGIQCGGGGKPCDTGLKGVCADGTMQCQKGVLTCVPNQTSSAEKCNALDDDCNGQVDEGDLCSAGDVCDRGRCVPRCGTGEFKCSPDEVCTDRGLCVDVACADVTCPPGQICAAGACSDACAGVVCPYGQLCRNGGCIDPCASVVCDQGYACVLGVCESCQCTTCASGLVCKSNVCIESACSAVTCTTGTHCEAGNCIDNCSAAACPKGMACSDGVCAPSSAGGPDADGGEPDTGIIILINTGGSTGAGGDIDADTAGSSAAGDQTDTSTRGRDAASGCGCRAGRGATPLAWAALLALGVLGAQRRRSKRKSDCNR
jgi:MYXO-CTERM domain-containing protein